MKAVTFLLSGLGLLAIASWGIVAQPNQQIPEDGIEVLARGPIHEGFAQPTEQKQAASPLVAKPPPEPIDELPPEQKPDAEDVIWIPGYWAWDEDREGYLWVSGIWRVSVPDRRWIPGYWYETTGGWQWVSGFWGPVAETIEVYPTPPEPVDEAIPPPADTNSFYVPGIWVYRDARYWWSPGHWVALRPGWVWIPARYCWTPVGYCFVPGRWDLDLDHRGMCFAPVYIDARLYQRRNWVYRPRHIVRVDFLLGSMFVNTRRHHYHFGDYYDAGYARRGFVPWVDYRFRNTYDPLFAYYRFQNRAQPRWEADLRAVYVDRRDNQAARPPRTLVMQEKAGGKKMMAVASFDQAKAAGVKLEAVSATQATTIKKTVTEWREVSQKRRTVETSAKGAAAKAAKGSAFKLDLPKTTIKPAVSKKAPPPDPVTPKFQEPKGKKDATPKDDPFKDKGTKDKTPKVDPFKDKTPKVDPFKDKTPKVDPFKDKSPKVDPFKDKSPKDGSGKGKSSKDDFPKEPKGKEKPPMEEKGKGKASKQDLPKEPKGKEKPAVEEKGKGKGREKDKDEAAGPSHQMHVVAWATLSQRGSARMGPSRTPSALPWVLRSAMLA
jgi:hypothetical protein